MEFSILSPVSLVLLIDFNGRMMELLFDFLKFEGTCLSSSSSVLRSCQIFWFMRFYLIFQVYGRWTGKGGSSRIFCIVSGGLCSIMTCLGWVVYSLLMSLEGPTDNGWKIFWAITVFGKVEVNRYIKQTVCFGWLVRGVTVSPGLSTGTAMMPAGWWACLVCIFCLLASNCPAQFCLLNLVPSHCVFHTLIACLFS